MRLVGTRVTTPLFIITSVSLLILSAVTAVAGKHLLVRFSKEAMPMFNNAVVKLRDLSWTLGVNLVSGVILA